MIDETRIGDILRSFIEVDTSNPPGKNYDKIVKIIVEQLNSTDCEIKLLKVPQEKVKELIKESDEVAGDRVNLVASIDRGKGKTMMLNGHMDVVPAFGDWAYSPFKLSVKDGEWYGRGVADMKGSLAALIVVFRELAVKNSWKGRLILTATVDEEIGGCTGLAYLMDESLIKSDYCIVGDGNATHITNASNGCLRFKVDIRGRAVHSSMNWRGINAIEKAANLVTRLEKYNLSLYKRRSKVHTSPEYGVDRLTPSLTVGVIKGGTKINIVPDRCEVDIDRRVVPEESKQKAIEEFKKILISLEEDDKEFKYDLLVGGLHDAFSTSKDNELIKALSASYKEVKGERCKALGGLGCYDAAHVAKHGIPTAVFGVSRLESNIHGINEKVKIEDLINFGLIVEKTVLRLMK